MQLWVVSIFWLLYNAPVNIVVYVFWCTCGQNSCCSGNVKKDGTCEDVSELPDGGVEWFLFRFLLPCSQTLVPWRKGEQMKSDLRVASLLCKNKWCLSSSFCGQSEQGARPPGIAAWAPARCCPRVPAHWDAAQSATTTCVSCVIRKQKTWWPQWSPAIWQLLCLRWLST